MPDHLLLFSRRKHLEIANAAPALLDAIGARGLPQIVLVAKDDALLAALLEDAGDGLLLL